MLNLLGLNEVKNAAGTSVKIVAATKTVPAEIVNLLPPCGITHAGENRVQELLSKFDGVSGIKWHFIGRLQTNKVKFLVDKVCMIQSVDRPALVDEIQRQCEKNALKMDILVELSLGEATKGGVIEDDLPALIDYILSKPNINLRGMMCLPPAGAKREIYEKVGRLYSDLKSRFGGFEYLSMGMSGDYKTAIECGANMIRPGSILFGDRQ